MNKVLILPAIFKSFRYRADKSCTITFETELEIKPEMIADFARFQNMHGFIAWKEDNKYTEEQIKAINDVDIKREGKTDSQLLRNVLYVRYKQSFYEGSFADFYNQEMKRIIQQEKNKLE